MNLCTDYASKLDIETVIFDAEIYERISDDNCPPKEKFKVPFNDAEYIGGYVEGEIASLFVVHDKKMHFMVLKKFRKYARELLNASFCMRPKDVYCVIPSLYPEVINFAKNYGFKQTAVHKNAHLKNGILYDNHILVYEVENGLCKRRCRRSYR